MRYGVLWGSGCFCTVGWFLLDAWSSIARWPPAGRRELYVSGILARLTTCGISREFTARSALNNIWLENISADIAPDRLFFCKRMASREWAHAGMVFMWWNWEGSRVTLRPLGRERLTSVS